jgi:hypothetical protein
MPAPRKTKINRVKIRQKLLAEFSEGKLQKLDKLCPRLDEFRWSYEEDNYRSFSAAFEALCLYAISLEDKVLTLDRDVSTLSTILEEKQDLIDKLLFETSEDDGLDIGDF